MPEQTTTPLMPHPYAIYHATSLFAMVRPNPEDWLRDRARHYRLVAAVCAPLSDLFALTNHCTSGDELIWTKRSQIVWVTSGASPRSTSVGDVFYSPRTGLAWLVSVNCLTRIL